MLTSNFRNLIVSTLTGFLGLFIALAALNGIGEKMVLADGGSRFTAIEALSGNADYYAWRLDGNSARSQFSIQRTLAQSDTITPTVILTAPAVSAVRDSIPIEWTASDDESGLKAITLTAQLPDGESIPYTLSTFSTGTLFISSETFHFTKTQMAGLYTFTLRAIDLANNLGTSSPATVQVEPVVTPSGVAISGTIAGIVTLAHFFTATVEPISVTLPITYIWQTTDHAVQSFPVSGTRQVISFTWSTPGHKTVIVTTVNRLNVPLTATHTIAISAARVISSGLDKGGSITDTIIGTTALQSITIIVPAGVFNEAFDLVYQDFVKESTGTLKPPIYHLFDLTAYQNGLPRPGSTAPITISVLYNPSFGDVARLRVYYFDEKTDTWRDVVETCNPHSTYRHDTQKRTIEVAVCHLTQFALALKPLNYIYLPLIAKPLPAIDLSLSSDSPTRLGSSTTLTAAVNPASQVTTYEWDFGDEQVTSTAENIVSHLYKQPGSYTAIVTARNQEGNETASASVAVYRPLINGDFEDVLPLNGWTQAQGGFDGHGIGLPQSEYGGHMALLGDKAKDGNTYNKTIPVGYGSIAQSFTVVERYLQIRYHISTYDIVQGQKTGRYFDTFEVSLDVPPEGVSNPERDAKCASAILNPTGVLPPTNGLVLCGGYEGEKGGNSNDLGWRKVYLDMTAYQGQEITLYFTVWNREYTAPDWDDKGYFNTWVEINDISMKASTQ